MIISGFIHVAAKGIILFIFYDWVVFHCMCMCVRVCVCITSCLSLVAQWFRIQMPMQETWVWSLGGEDALEKDMATHSSILAWKIPWTEEPGGWQSLRVTKSQTQRGEYPTTITDKYITPSLSWKWKLLSSVRLFATPRTIESVAFSRPEHWSG